MVADVIMSSNTAPTVEILDNLTNQDLSDELKEEKFGQMLIKSWIAEMIKEFKRQLFREASFYLHTMEEFVKKGEAYLSGTFL
jgi:hypothetical protein